MAFHTCNHKRTRLIGLAAALVCAGYASAASAQSLPWQSPPQAQTQPMQPAPYPYGQPQYPSQNPPQYPSQNPPQGQGGHHHHGGQGGGQHASHAAPSGGARAQDDRELNLLATKYYKISSKDPNAISKLTRLGGEVSEYRKGLDEHGYDATDIKSDAKKLAGRIAYRRKKLEQAQAAAEQQPAAAQPAKVIAPAEALAPATPPAAPLPPTGAPLPTAMPPAPTAPAAPVVR